MSPVTFPAFVPSALRTIVAPQTAGTGTRLSAASVLPARFPAKASFDALDYSLDLDAWLADIADTVASVSATVSPTAGQAADPSDLGVVWVTVLNGRPTLMLAGGVPSGSYVVMVAVRTVGGRRELFPVVQQITADGAATAADLPARIATALQSGAIATAALAPNVLMLDATHALVLADGTPLLAA